jgi:hypothetical protein
MICPEELKEAQFPLIGVAPSEATDPADPAAMPRIADTPEPIPLPSWFMIWMSGVSVGACGELVPLPIT